MKLIKLDWKVLIKKKCKYQYQYLSSNLKDLNLLEKICKIKVCKM